MSKIQPTTDTPPVPVVTSTADKSPAEKDNTAHVEQASAKHVDPLPWLIHQLRGRYECAQVSSDKSSKEVSPEQH